MADDLESRTTQPTLMALLELVREVQRSQGETNARLASIEARLTSIQAEIQTVNGRVTDTAAETKGLLNTISRKIEILNRSRLETEAGYESVLQRIENLESKAS